MREKCIKTLWRSCPICGKNEGTILCSIDLCAIDNEYLPTYFDVVSCTQCGFVFDDIQATQKDFDQYYATINKYQTEGTSGSGGSSPKDQKRWLAIYTTLQQYISSEDKILDIGAGKGGMLAYLRERGFTNLYAVEPSARSGHYNGITFYNSLQETIATGHQFDAIFCSQVLEHVFDLQQFLKSISQLCKDSGILYIDVPNALAYNTGYLAPYYYFDREHINHFTPVALQNLASATGYSMIYIYIYIYHAFLKIIKIMCLHCLRKDSLIRSRVILICLQKMMI